MSKNLSIRDFQTEIGGKKTGLFFLENRHGVRIAITNYGARIVAVWMPDSEGELDNIVVGYDSISGYLEHEEIYLGATVGRYANRIKEGSFSLGGIDYQLSRNEGTNHLHGGFNGFHNRIWGAEQSGRNELILRHHSKDGEEGYPGNLEVEVLYTLSDSDELIIEYKASSDRNTILNVTNHSYFNLGGETANTNARSHELMINAGHYLPVDNNLIPTGELAEVKDTPFDFQNPKPVAERINIDHPQLKRGEGYDHTFVLDKQSANDYVLAARVRDPSSGRAIEVKTTEPGMQFFECRLHNDLDLNMDTAFCLETQHFPDSPNQPRFPSTVLKAGRQFYSKTGYLFTVKERSESLKN